MHLENIPRLGPNDIIAASYPGAGSTWLGSLFVTLGIFYLDANELVPDDRSQTTHLTSVARKERLPILMGRDERNVTYREPLRVFKTHFVPQAIGDALTKNPIKVVLLVRDGRDCLISYYHWLQSFANTPPPMPEFLDCNFNDLICSIKAKPAMAWAAFNAFWWDAVPSERRHLVRFEQGRTQPLETVRAMLDFLGVERSDAEIEAAIEESSYKNMRRLEDAAIKTDGDRIGRGRIMRKGQIGEWREVLTQDMLRTFEGKPNEVLDWLGYESLHGSDSLSA
jgi:hypothetical protein